MVGKKWGNALGGYKLQNRKGGKFSSGFAGTRVSASAPSMTKGQRRYAAYQKSQKKARNKKIAKAAVAVAVVGAGAYATNRSYQNTKTARPIEMYSVNLSATRGARGNVRSPGGKNRPLKLETKPKEILTSADGSTTTRALKSLGINSGTPVQFGTNQDFQIKSGKKPNRSIATKALAGAVVVNTTAQQINSAARNAEELKGRAERLSRSQVNRGTFEIKRGKAPGRRALPIVRDESGRRVSVDNKPHATGLTERGNRERPVTSEFAGGDWENEMGRHFSGSNRGHWETGDSGSRRDTRKDKNKGKTMRSVTLEASPEAMHRSSRSSESNKIRGQLDLSVAANSRAAAMSLDTAKGKTVESVVAEINSGRQRRANRTAVNYSNRSRRANANYLAGSQVVDPASIEGFGPEHYVSGKMTKTTSITTFGKKMTSNGRVMYSDRKLQAAIGDPVQHAGYRFDKNPHLTSAELNYARAFEDRHRAGKPITERQAHTYSRIVERSEQRSKTSRGDNPIGRVAAPVGSSGNEVVNPTRKHTPQGRAIIPLHKQQGTETIHLRGLSRAQREEAARFESILESEGHGTAGLHLSNYKTANEIAELNEVVGYAQFSANGAKGTDKLGKKGKPKKSSKNKRDNYKSQRR